MKNTVRKKRSFSGMSYREVQRSNSNRRDQLTQESQNWLKKNGYKNVGWDNVIRLYQKINDLLATTISSEPSLEELFLQADQIGSKYQTQEEIDNFNQQLTAEVNLISEIIDQQFPEDEIEFIDYSAQPNKIQRFNNRQRKTR